MSTSNIFRDFTNLYSLSKTLKFKLKPEDDTQKMLEDAKVFEKDETIQKKYEATKPYFDRLHREFVREALQEAKLSELDGYLEIFKKWKVDKKENQKKFKEKEKELRKEVVKFFDAQGKLWARKYKGLKNTDIEVLFEEAVFEAILKERYQNDPIQKDGKILPVEVLDESTGELVSIFSSWERFTGYFKKFFETRKNFYKDDGTASALATRIIDQNLKRFCDNILIFEKLRAKVDFAEVEHNFGKALSDIFSLDFYNSCLLQDGIDFYNKIIGGETLPNGEKKKGLNECINLHKQQKDEKWQFFIALDNQILSEKEKFSIDEIKGDEELFNALKEFSQCAEKRIIVLKKLFTNFVEHQENYNLGEIYFSKEAFNTISRKWTNETGAFEEALYKTLKKANIVTSSAKKKEGGYSFPEFFALCYIKDALETVITLKFWKQRYHEVLEFEGKTPWEQFLVIFNYEFSSLFEKEIINQKTEKAEKIGYSIFQEDLKKLIENFKVDSDAKVTIKNYADSVLTIYQMAKYFALEKKRAWNTDFDLDVFYTDPINGYLQFYENAYEEIVQVYNKFRNYLTKKTYNLEKWKLNFENSTLADGWDKNKEADNFAVILRKDGKYFLGLMVKGHNKIFDDRNAGEFSQNIENGKYEKMNYKFFPDQAKMFPKVCFSAKGLNFFQPPNEIRDIYENNEFKKGDNFSIASMQKLIDFYKSCLTKYEGWKGYDFKHLKPTKDYRENIGEFFRDVAEDGYKITFQNISESYINKKNQKGELYLFQINSKDWSKHSKGTKNLHTLYFEALFSAENISLNFPIKLNGQAEIFYRPKTDVQKLGTKKDKKGKEVVNHKRYKEDKIFFHVPIMLNRTKNEARYFNSNLNFFLAKNSNVNIIGVDRGEKNLAYFSVINQKGEILDSGSLNLVGKDGEGKAIDYHKKLEEKAEEREQARKDWQTIEGIKDLKKGYISQVVHKLAELALQHNAIIVFEDLNMRFKQIRGGIEKSVYQQLEKALIDKLSYLVNKREKDPEQAGYLLKAYQLSAPFTSFKEMGKQTGIIFYTKASYTSKIDPVTGWRPHLYLKYSNSEKAKKDISLFSNIRFVNERFEFTYDIKKFQPKNENFSKNTIWTVCSSVERYRWDSKSNNNKGEYVYYEDLTKNFKELFVKAGVDISRDILSQINVLEVKRNERFFRDFIFYFTLICQIRNTNDKAKEPDGQDFIFSPVEPFFDSRNPEKSGIKLPKNGDDNGAYNIARKGIVILQKITDYANKQGNCDKLSWEDLNISDVEWDNFAQGK